jgi:hypothetical protein
MSSPNWKFDQNSATQTEASNDEAFFASENLKDHHVKIDAGAVDLEAIHAMAKEIASGTASLADGAQAIGEHHINLGNSRTEEQGRAVAANKAAAEKELKVAEAESTRAKADRDKHQPYSKGQKKVREPLSPAERVELSVIVATYLVLAGIGVAVNGGYLERAGMFIGLTAYAIGFLPLFLGKVAGFAFKRSVSGEQAVKQSLKLSGGLIVLAGIVWACTIGSEGSQNALAVSGGLASADPLGLSAAPASLARSTSSFVEYRGVIRMIAQVTIEVIGSAVLCFVFFELLGQATDRHVHLTVVESCPIYAKLNEDFVRFEEQVKRLTQRISLCDKWEAARIDAIQSFKATAQAALVNTVSLIQPK